MAPISWITEELTEDIGDFRQKQSKIHRPEYAFSGSSYNYKLTSERASEGKQGTTNVSRGPREVDLLTSIPGIFCLGRTSLLFSCDEYHTRCYDSLMDPVGRATYERSLVIVSLKGTRKVEQPAMIRLREDKRLIWPTSSAVC